jgi:hypothetical protein
MYGVEMFGTTDPKSKHAKIGVILSRHREAHRATVHCAKAPDFEHIEIYQAGRRVTAIGDIPSTGALIAMAAA